ncbi:MAG: translational GTPase TypA [Anaerolineae bacterium]|nr:translational GTPase TypA [Anaerolineae bacterium]
MIQERKDIRNIAIIAHVDHGKTTLVDALLKQTSVFRENQVVVERVMDSNDLERERGITILAKNTSVVFKDTKINIVDTPGHADFGGEVERVMNMVDGVLLLVDAVDGPMPQTRFVLRKALEMGHKAIVVVNKIDRPNARPNFVTNATFDLFIELGASDEQSEFPIIYTNAIEGLASTDPEDFKHPDPSQSPKDLNALFEAVVRYLPGPKVDLDAPSQLLVTTLGYDDYKGRIAIGRLSAGKLNKAQEVMRMATDGTQYRGKLSNVFTHQGLNRIEMPTVEAGDIVAITGIPDIYIGETIADFNNPVALPPIRVEEPTVRMTFGVNTSPFAGREGQWGTTRKLRERLYRELESNVSLRVEDGATADKFTVSGRGELHLVILIETMRREGYEFEIGKPEVIYKTDENGQVLEPYEELFIEVTDEYLGGLVETLAARQGQMLDMKHNSSSSASGAVVSTVMMHYKIPTRGLFGFRGQLLTGTRGTAVMNTLFWGYEPIAPGDVRRRDRGSLIAWEDGEAVTYGLRNAWERGQLFIEASTMVYEGMIVGEHARPDDLEVNVCKTKTLTKVRTRASDHDTSRLPPIRPMTLDDCVEYIADDELVEITPVNIRMRKRLLAKDERARVIKAMKEAMAGE